MSDADDTPLKFALHGDQRLAVEPADTVWLGASAGTGKTQVLSAREAGMLPGTRAMEDRDKDLLVKQVLAEVLVKAQTSGDAALVAALAGLSVRLTSEQVEGWLLRCAEAREMWFGTGAWQPPLRPRLARLLGLGEDPQAALLDLCGDRLFDCQALRRCVTAQAEWGTRTGLAAADAVVGWLAAGAAVRVERLDELWKALFTGDGNPRSLAAMLKLDTGYAEAIERVRDSIGRALEFRGLIALADYAEPALLLGRAFALAWDEAKQREGFIDFDDQIRHAAALLGRADMADWVRFKLDRQFDHILVDEAQDTNARQWEIVDALIGDFFAGEGQRGEALRTLFVVGDYKQAIFRFQGTSPENFEAARRRVREQMLGVERELRDYGLDRSFRTARPVLEFVDRAIGEIGFERFGLQTPPEPHRGEDRPGLVTLWPIVGGEDGSEDEG
ncbi:MAG: UvrD-helicase domain-containing protein, partial [Novosphingobium sp.]|nr:UvrD-helicase domain-containing protein [Novosphingobium sp.]